MASATPAGGHPARPQPGIRRDGYARVNLHDSNDAPQVSPHPANAADFPPFEVSHFIESERLHNWCFFFLGAFELLLLFSTARPATWFEWFWSIFMVLFCAATIGVRTAAGRMADQARAQRWAVRVIVASTVLMQACYLAGAVVNSWGAVVWVSPLASMLATFVPYAGPGALILSSLAISRTTFAALVGLCALTDGIFVWYVAGTLQSQLQEEGVRSTAITFFAVRAASTRTLPNSIPPLPAHTHSLNSTRSALMRARSSSLPWVRRSWSSPLPFSY